MVGPSRLDSEWFDRNSTSTAGQRTADASDAVIPNPKVTARNVGTNVNLETLTNELGNYELNNLNPGRFGSQLQDLIFKWRHLSEILASHGNGFG